MLRLCPTVINFVCWDLFICVLCHQFLLLLSHTGTELVRLRFLVFMLKLYYKLKNVRLKLIGKTVMLVLKSEFPFY